MSADSNSNVDLVKIEEIINQLMMLEQALATAESIDLLKQAKDLLSIILKDKDIQNLYFDTMSAQKLNYMNVAIDSMIDDIDYFIAIYTNRADDDSDRARLAFRVENLQKLVRGLSQDLFLPENRAGKSWSLTKSTEIGQYSETLAKALHDLALHTQSIIDNFVDLSEYRAYIHTLVNEFEKIAERVRADVKRTVLRMHRDNQRFKTYFFEVKNSDLVKVSVGVDGIDLNASTGHSFKITNEGMYGHLGDYVARCNLPANYSHRYNNFFKHEKLKEIVTEVMYIMAFEQVMSVLEYYVDKEKMCDRIQKHFKNLESLLSMTNSSDVKKSKVEDEYVDIVNELINQLMNLENKLTTEPSTDILEKTGRKLSELHNVDFYRELLLDSLKNEGKNANKVINKIYALNVLIDDFILHLKLKKSTSYHIEQAVEHIVEISRLLNIPEHRRGRVWQSKQKDKTAIFCELIAKVVHDLALHLAEYIEHANIKVKALQMNLITEIFSIANKNMHEIREELEDELIILARKDENAKELLHRVSRHPINVYVGAEGIEIGVYIGHSVKITDEGIYGHVGDWACDVIRDIEFVHPSKDLISNNVYHQALLKAVDGLSRIMICEQYYRFLVNVEGQSKILNYLCSRIKSAYLTLNTAIQDILALRAGTVSKNSVSKKAHIDQVTVYRADTAIYDFMNLEQQLIDEKDEEIGTRLVSTASGGLGVLSRDTQLMALLELGFSSPDDYKVFEQTLKRIVSLLDKYWWTLFRYRKTEDADEKAKIEKKIQRATNTLTKYIAIASSRMNVPEERRGKVWKPRAKTAEAIFREHLAKFLHDVAHHMQNSLEVLYSRTIKREDIAKLAEELKEIIKDVNVEVEKVYREITGNPRVDVISLVIGIDGFEIYALTGHSFKIKENELIGHLGDYVSQCGITPNMYHKFDVNLFKSQYIHDIVREIAFIMAFEQEMVVTDKDKHEKFCEFIIDHYNKLTLYLMKVVAESKLVQKAVQIDEKAIKKGEVAVDELMKLERLLIDEKEIGGGLSLIIQSKNLLEALSNDEQLMYLFEVTSELHDYEELSRRLERIINILEEYEMVLRSYMNHQQLKNPDSETIARLERLIQININSLTTHIAETSLRMKVPEKRRGKVWVPVSTTSEAIFREHLAKFLHDLAHHIQNTLEMYAEMSLSREKAVQLVSELKPAVQQINREAGEVHKKIADYKLDTYVFLEVGVDGLELYAGSGHSLKIRNDSIAGHLGDFVEHCGLKADLDLKLDGVELFSSQHIHEIVNAIAYIMAFEQILKEMSGENDAVCEIIKENYEWLNFYITKVMTESKQVKK